MNKHEGRNHPPININVIQQGIKTALINMFNSDSEKPVEAIRFQPPPPPPSYRRHGVYAKPTLDETLGLHEPGTHQASLIGPWASVAMFNPPVEEDDVKDKNVLYVGLEDMASLLGFDDDDNNDWVANHATVAQSIRHGRSS
jgi:hypothetical protein